MPKKFDFRLQRVLDYRKMLEEQKKYEFIQAQREVILQETKLVDLYTQENEEKLYLSQLKKGLINPISIRLMESYLAGILKRISYEKEVLNQLKEEMFRKKTEFVEARKKTRLLERLKEKRFEEHKYELEREERRFLDEVGMNGFIRMNAE